MVFFQIVIGGITRLTGSGLSITEWDIVMGSIPPLNEPGWIEEFEKYKATPQYQKINEGMSLSQFKFIYFWEYLHRLWARIMGFVFIIPFLFFYSKKALPGRLRQNLLKVVLLAMAAASFGWIMVASGLIDRPWVNAYKLSLHLLLGISVFVVLFWSVYDFVKVGPGGRRPIQLTYPRLLKLILIVLVIQIIFGGWMSGMRAALFYPNWPLIGDHVFPPDIFLRSNWSLQSFIHYDRGPFVVGLIQVLHRMTAYVIVIMVMWYVLRNRLWLIEKKGLVSITFFLSLLVVQIVLGIVTLLLSKSTIPVLWGVLHQGVGVLVFTACLFHYFEMKYAYVDSD
jgi:cytochrome c oxidase assembly protein subunit 15